jgi:hypothetical protein
MLYVSKHVKDNEHAKLSLWRGQCSCAYWHGIFGGLYLPHLREAIYRNLIEAESPPHSPKLETIDFDADGEPELVYSDEHFFAVIKPKTASFVELDDRSRKLNLMNVLGRRKEKYHLDLPVRTDEGDVKSIHEVAKSKEQGLQKYLIYDTYERAFGIDRVLETEPSTQDFRCGVNIGSIVQYEDYTISDRHDHVVEFTGPIKKCIEFAAKNQRTLRLRYSGECSLLGVEFSLGIFHGNPRLNEKSLRTMLTLQNLTNCVITADGFAPVILKSDTEFDIHTYPIETVSSSEAGFERIFQGIAALLVFRQMPAIDIQL